MENRFFIFNHLMLFVFSMMIFSTLFSSLLYGQGPYQNPKLWKEIDLIPCGGDKGFYPSFGDLDNDGRTDFLLHRVGNKGAVGYMIALDHDGNVLWQLGDSTLAGHRYWKTEPPNRAIAIVFDIDHDRRSEVITEIFGDGNYRLLIMDGKTGKIKKNIYFYPA